MKHTVAGQTSRHMVRYQGDGARYQHGRNSTGAGRWVGEGALPGCPRAAFPEMAQDSQVCARPTAGHPTMSQPALPG